jgi:hypothetical protein
MLYLRNLARKMGIVLSYTMKQLIKFKRKKKQKGGSRIGIGPLPVGPVGYHLIGWPIGEELATGTNHGSSGKSQSWPPTGVASMA